VPYGIDAHQRLYRPELKQVAVCQFLFVGQGIQRKGLHHLLKAWGRAKLPGAELTIIASRCDPGIAALAGNNVRILDHQPSQALAEFYNRSHVFVLPSLIEGFGLVFLEALAAGCFCIGTSNTGLPDLSPPAEAAKIVPAGDIVALTVALEEALDSHNRGEIDANTIRSFASTLSWRRFRESLVKVVANKIL
jgi:glycosyltransferase involved in cell wall biosynthesis